MKIAFIQFNGMTTLDLIGFYDTVLRLPRFSTMDVSSDLCALTEEVRDEYGLVLKTQKVQPGSDALATGGTSSASIAGSGSCSSAW
ncbi:hypothetical protein [Sulfoacidibacillus ferrooxidans]|nr:hypothetical protein [Sulfoacidibacillus ferrooxidans]